MDFRHIGKRHPKNRERALGICFNFVNTETCKDGVGCKYRHPSKPLLVGTRVSVVGYDADGTIAFSGIHHSKGTARNGVRLDKPVGNNDGSVSGVSYFDAQPKCGVLVEPSKCSPLKPDKAASTSTVRPAKRVDMQLGTYYRVPLYGWVRYGPQRLTSTSALYHFGCLCHHKRVLRCPNRKKFCSEHTNMFQACSSCTPEKRCALHSKFPLRTKTTARTAGKVPAKAQRLKLDKPSRAFRRHMHAGAAMYVGKEMVTVISSVVHMNGTVTLTFGPPLKNAMDVSTMVQPVHVSQCKRCQAKRMPQPSVKTVFCNEHTSEIAVCRVCRARFTTCDRHMKTINACTVCT